MSGKFVRNLKRKHAELISSSSNTNPTQTTNNNSASVSVSNISENISAPEENQLKYHRCEKNNTGDEHSSESSTSSSDIDKNCDNYVSRNQSKSSVQEPRNDEFLRAALVKIEELENELANDYRCDSRSADSDSDQENEQQLGYDSEALGFAVCARETLTFLASQGLPQDNPLIVSLRNRLIGKCSSIPI